MAAGRTDGWRRGGGGGGSRPSIQGVENKHNEGSGLVGETRRRLAGSGPRRGVIGPPPLGEPQIRPFIASV